MTFKSFSDVVPVSLGRISRFHHVCYGSGSQSNKNTTKLTFGRLPLLRYDTRTKKTIKKAKKKLKEKQNAIHKYGAVKWPNQDLAKPNSSIVIYNNQMHPFIAHSCHTKEVKCWI